jgi:hypothetical protein
MKGEYARTSQSSCVPAHLLKSKFFAWIYYLSTVTSPRRNRAVVIPFLRPCDSEQDQALALQGVRGSPLSSFC